MTEYPTGEELLARMRKPACEECGAAIPQDGSCLSALRVGETMRYSIECPQCGATERFESVAEAN